MKRLAVRRNALGRHPCPRAPLLAGETGTIVTDLQLVALAASSMRSAVILGWLIMATWEEVGTSTSLRAFARPYIQRSHAAGIALSWPATSPHDGIVRHAAA